MARARNLKPGFFKNEDLAECSPLARILFAGLWCLADRAGRLEDRPKRIRAEVLPYDDGSVDDMLKELHDAGFILRYQVGGDRFIQVLNFAKHQNPHCREPESVIHAPDEHNTSTVQAPDEHRTGPADSLLLIPDSLNLIPEKPSCSPSASELAKKGFADFWKAYPNKKAKPKAEAAWRKLKPSAPTIADLMASLDRHKASEQWLRDGGQYIPHPATWLNGRRWEDQLPEAHATTGANAADAKKPQPGDTRTRYGATERFDECMGWVPA